MARGQVADYDLYTLQDLANQLDSGAEGEPVPYSEPATSPAPATVTLFTLYGQMPVPQTNGLAALPSDVFDPDRSGVEFWGLGAADSQWGPQSAAAAMETVNPDTDRLPAGWLATNIQLSEVDADLSGANLLTNMTVFGVPGEGIPQDGAPCPVPAITNGGTVGVPWPEPRFETYSDPVYTNCVLDRLTGLTWIQSPLAMPYSTNPTLNHADALIFCETLDGAEGRGGYEDWRLASVRELESLAAYVPDPDVLFIPHTNVFNLYAASFWTRTSFAEDSSRAWYAYFPYKSFIDAPKTLSRCIWPVRGP